MEKEIDLENFIEKETDIENFMEKETDLFLPIKNHFEEMGYKVNAEVKNFDIVLSKDDGENYIKNNKKEIIIIETKLRFNTKLLFQAINAQKITNFVYIAIPMQVKRDFDKILYISKKLGFGVITVSDKNRVEINISHEEINCNLPKNAAKRDSIIREIKNRKFDTNEGGSSRKKIKTVYKEQSIQIATILLNVEGSISPKELIDIYGCPKSTNNILNINIYDWFERVGHGRYKISQIGKYEMENVYTDISQYYAKIFSKIDPSKYYAKLYLEDRRSKRNKTTPQI
ncbi:MAG: DUF2161 family putative PD-(D/E)XK-type phosphodiesterase [Defluviitaleaceae bacterium]|nr:DUF2161 family putative PD-(D/E)XK-type phosphodiesterase [Defluviitaleaceae bacterium]